GLKLSDIWSETSAAASFYPPLPGFGIHARPGPGSAPVVLGENPGMRRSGRIAEQHRRTVEEKLADLARLASELRRLSACCRGKGLIANCRIIEALSP